MNNTGYVGQRKRDGKWFARLTWTDEATGRRIDRTKFSKTEEHARRLLAQLIADSGFQSVTAPLAHVDSPAHTTDAPRLFSTILNEYEAIKVVPATYRDDRKIAGLKSERTVKIRLVVLRDYFGEMTASAITPAVIERFRLKRLNTPTQYGRDRAIASVNRELELLRSVMLWAVGEGYIQKAPKAHIVKAHETRRERILTPVEEKRLLKACDTPDRKQIIPIVIFALETGARANEIKQVRWSDVDLKARTITLRATTTKTIRKRTLPLSKRLLDVLSAMPDAPRESRIFPVTTWQKSWNAACRDAGIVGLRFHDLRATFITRMIEKGLPAEIIAKVSGHADHATLYRHYVRAGQSAVDLVRAALDSVKR